MIKVSKDKKNAATVGIVGKIRSVIENLFLNKGTFNTFDMATLFNAGVEYSVGIESTCSWSLKKYKKAVSEENTKDWDELEKSIIANLADDVIVGVKGKRANIIVVKNIIRG